MSLGRVSASEAELLTLARALVGQVPLEGAEHLVRSRRKLAPKIGPTAMRLLEQTLAAGATLSLARRGGARPARHVRGTQVVSGRAWELHPDLLLSFSPATFQVLRWMLENSLAMPAVPALHVEALTPADELVLHLACDLVVRAGCEPALHQGAVFGRSALCWLGFPAELAGTRQASLPPDAQRFSALVRGPGLALLEALQGDLAARWVALARDKARLADPERLAGRSEVERALLDAWLTAVEREGREDLALFLLDAAVELLKPGTTSRHFVAPLDRRGPLAERTEARRAAGAYLRALLRMAGWVERWRATPFFEDSYAASQMLLSSWERFGDEPIARAQAILRELETLDAAVEIPPAGPSKISTPKAEAVGRPQ